MEHPLQMKTFQYSIVHRMRCIFRYLWVVVLFWNLIWSMNHQLISTRRSIRPTKCINQTYYYTHVVLTNVQLKRTAAINFYSVPDEIFVLFVQHIYKTHFKNLKLLREKWIFYAKFGNLPKNACFICVCIQISTLKLISKISKIISYAIKLFKWKVDRERWRSFYIKVNYCRGVERDSFIHNAKWCTL